MRTQKETDLQDRIEQLEALLDEYKDAEHRALKAHGEALQRIEQLELELRYKLDQSERIKNLEAEVDRLETMLNHQALGPTLAKWQAVRAENDELRADAETHDEQLTRVALIRLDLEAENKALLDLVKYACDELPCDKYINNALAKLKGQDD